MSNQCINFSMFKTKAKQNNRENKALFFLQCTLNSVINLAKQWHPTPVLLPGKSHGWRNLVGCRPWGREESDRTERFHFHFSLSRIGEGNWQPAPVFLPGESQGRGSLVVCRLWGRTESDTTEVT